MSGVEGWTAVEIGISEAMLQDPIALDLLSGALFELGAEGLETVETVSPAQVVAAFPPDREGQYLVELVAEALASQGIEVQSISARPYAPIDWATHWRRHFSPLSFGRLWIVPSWLEAPKDAGAILWIDPSMAFGTGLHATTASCIEAIVSRSPLGSVLDVGTGTGILALAALRLGAGRTVAIDNDPDAVTVARENAEKNGLASSLILGGMPVEDIEERFELVVANILAGPLVEMAPSLSRRVAPGGGLVLSGILATQADQVAAAYQAEGLLLDGIFPREEWVRIDLRRPAETH